MNAVVVDGSDQEPLPGYRTKVSQFVNENPGLGWGYDRISDFFDLIDSITKAEGGALGTTVEIVAHGSPTHHHIIGGTYLVPTATYLRTLLPVAKSSTVYLTGCNTGLTPSGYCVARELARALHGITVCGAVGFVMSGTAMTQDVVTAATVKGKHYKGGRDETGSDCWKCFYYAPSLTPQFAMGPSGEGGPIMPTPEIPPDILRSAINEARRMAIPAELPPLLIGPDQRGVIELEDGPFAYEILLHGSILRNAISRETFELPNGSELLDRALAPR